MLTERLDQQAIPGQRDGAAANGAPPAGREPGPAGADHQRAPACGPVEARKTGQKKPRGLVTVGALLALALGVAGSLAAALGWQAKDEAQAAARQAIDERDQARKAGEEAERQREQALAARKAAAAERDQALAAERAAQRSEQDAKAVLDFLQNSLLSVGRDKGWGSAGPRKNVTLREAVDAAEPKVAALFEDRPLVEASVREALGSAYLDLGEPKQAIQQLQRALELRQGWLGPDHADTGDCRNKLAIAYRRAGRHDEASSLNEQGTNSSSLAAALAVRGSLLLAQKKPAEAELKLRECLAIRQKVQPDDWSTFDAQALLGEALLAQKKYAEAEPMLLAGYEGMKRHEAKAPPQGKVRLARTLEGLVRLYEARGRKDEAAKWRKELRSAQTAKKT